jgi:hypothetical protein
MDKVSVILPAYNEASKIENTVARVAEALRQITSDFEIIIAEDGSTDGTDRKAAELASRHGFVKHIHSDVRLGRGAALKNAFLTSQGDILVYMDIDLATDLAHLSELVGYIRSGYDFATGSRMMPESSAERPLKRRVASTGFNFLTRFFLRSQLYDHQCGFKAFRRSSLMKLLGEVRAEHWFWDTEFLVRAQRAGYKVKEFPVRWKHPGGTKVKFFRDIAGMGTNILRLWWKLSVSKRFSTKVKIAIASLIAVAILFITIYSMNLGKVAQAVSTVSLAVLFLAALVYLVEWPIRGLRYRFILRGIKYEEGLNFLTGTVFLSQLANLVLPMRIGDLTRAYVLKSKKNIPYTSGLSSLAVERVFDVLAIAVIGLAAVALFAKSGALPSWISTVMLLSVILLFAFFLFFIYLAVRKKPLIQRSGKVADVLNRFLKEIGTVSLHPQYFVIIFALSILIWLVESATTFVVLLAFGVTPALLVVFLGVAISSLSKTLPITPGGIGPYEAILAFILFEIGGISSGIAGGVSVIDHAIKNVVTLVFGFVYLYYFNLSLSDIVERHDT